MAKTTALATGATNQVMTQVKFNELCDLEFEQKHEQMIVEYKERKASLVAFRDMKKDEYQLLTLLANLNTALIEKKRAIELIDTFQTQVSAISYETSVRSLSIGKWRSEIGSKITGVVCDILDYFLRQFNVKENLNTQQIMMLASKIVNESPDLKVKELLHCLNLAVNGEYGETYNHIGVSDIAGWLKKYYEAQAVDRENKYYANKQNSVNGVAVWEKKEREFKDWEKGEKRKAEVKAKIKEVLDSKKNKQV